MAGLFLLMGVVCLVAAAWVARDKREADQWLVLCDCGTHVRAKNERDAMDWLAYCGKVGFVLKNGSVYARRVTE